jgi:VIT1/CCC1 family predicted Fe2+/Mn2+ transporter
VTPNPYRAPLLAARPPIASAVENRANAFEPPAAERGPRRVRRVRSGIGTALAGHGVAVILPMLPSMLTDDPGPVFAVCGVVAQLLLAAFVVALGVARTVRRDGANAVGLVIGWMAGVPVAAIVGLFILANLAT